MHGEDDGPVPEDAQAPEGPGVAGFRVAALVAAVAAFFLAFLYLSNKGQVQAPVQDQGYAEPAAPAQPPLPDQVQGAEAPPMAQPPPAELEFQVVDPQEYYDAVDAAKSADEPVYIDCNPRQRIPTEGPDGAKVAPCGGNWFGPDPGLTSRDAWYDQPKPYEPGTRRDDLRYRFEERAEPAPLPDGIYRTPLGTLIIGPAPNEKLPPGEYRLPYGTLTIHPDKD
ncbi:MAG TPA: hypothetical protein VD862_03295 [Candidatus Paceibacterota bacterium]|nr:hypothetical protein [Candidatus Paceibacterota bacterium]